MAKKKEVVETTTTEVKEGSKFGWGVLGFFIPLVGLILFLVWKKDKKKAAKAAGIGALVGFLLGLVSSIIMFALGFGTLLGIGVTSEYYENTDTKTKVEEKKKDETKKEETKKEEKQIVDETADPSENCNYVITKADRNTYAYDFSYDESCGTAKILDESNKVLFKIKNNKIFLNNGEEVEYFNKELYKIDNSIVLYSTMCSPGYCYAYVYNTNDNTSFKIENTIEKEGDIVVPMINGIQANDNKDLVVYISNNYSASFESVQNNPKAIIIQKVRSCEISDVEGGLNIDEELQKAGLNNFPTLKTYTYKNVNGNITNNPTMTVKETIKDLVWGFGEMCMKYYGVN